MPTYRYRCQHCGEEFDIWQSIKDDALRTHDQGCGGELAKVFSPAGIVLKGSGFYRNDSRAGARSGASKDQESKNGDSSTDSSKESGKESGKESSKESSKEPSKDTKSTDTKSSDPKSGSPSTAGTKPS
jgi:putative FmdB family regulatory protein